MQRLVPIGKRSKTCYFNSMNSHRPRTALITAIQSMVG
jgi:hypothetical protein